MAADRVRLDSKFQTEKKVMISLMIKSGRLRILLFFFPAHVYVVSNLILFADLLFHLEWYEFFWPICKREDW